MRSSHSLIVAVFVAVGFGPASDGAAQRTEAPQWTVERVLRIGSIDDPDQALTRVTNVLFGPAGRIVIPQPQDRTVRVFDSAGRLLGRIGRRGEGPGEFGSLSTAGFRGDTLWVGDDGLRRLTFFDLEGRLLRTLPWPTALQRFDGGIHRIGVPAALLPDGTGIVEVGMAAAMAGGTPVMMPALPYVRIDPASSTVDTLALRELVPRRMTQVNAGGSEFSVFWTIDDSPVHTIAPDGGIVIVERFRAEDTDPSTFRVLRIDVEGDTAFSRDIPHRPIPTPASVTARVVAELVERLDRGQGVLTPGPVERALRSADLIPATLEPVSHVAVAADGTTWLKLATETATAPWLVLDRAGRPVGRLELPAGQRVLAATDDRIAALELDEFDVPYVVVYRLAR